MSTIASPHPWATTPEPRGRRVSRYALALATLLAVYPANVQAAIGDGTPGVPGWGGTRQAAIARLPLQAPPVWAAWRLWRHG